MIAIEFNDKNAENEFVKALQDRNVDYTAEEYRNGKIEYYFDAKSMMYIEGVISIHTKVCMKPIYIKPSVLVKCYARCE